MYQSLLSSFNGIALDREGDRQTETKTETERKDREEAIVCVRERVTEGEDLRRNERRLKESEGERTWQIRIGEEIIIEKRRVGKLKSRIGSSDIVL